jgi:hypothetical protein
MPFKREEVKRALSEFCGASTTLRLVEGKVQFILWDGDKRAGGYDTKTRWFYVLNSYAARHGLSEFLIQNDFEFKRKKNGKGADGRPKFHEYWAKTGESAFDDFCRVISLEPGSAADFALEWDARGQGFSADPAARKAIELRAMEVAAEWLEAEGHAWIDVSAKASYDISTEKDGIRTKIEVKGTTHPVCRSIRMTRNEVDLHRQEQGRTALITVAGISLDRSIDPPLAAGGTIEVHWHWRIDDWIAEPLSYQVTRPVRG